MKKIEVAELNRIYDEADSMDSDVFAEQRSNVLLVSGEHYTKSSQKYMNAVRSSKDLTETQKLRLTKNLTHKIVKYYADTILALSPDGTIRPRNDKELQDIKSAELNKSVYNYLKDILRIKEHFRNGAEDFSTLGEVASLIKWDYSKGRFKGYEQLANEDGDPMFEDELGPDGQPVAAADESKPVFSGSFVIERLYGFNLLLHAGSKNGRDPLCWIVRKMVPNKDLKGQFGDTPETRRALDDSAKEEFVVFDSQKGKYERSKNQTLVREYYYPPSFDCPLGYFAIATDRVILAEGPLPGGIFPIMYGAFDNFQTARRGRSILKVARPYQAEINRASSAQAMQQITLGDDKILYQAGTKLQGGALLPGVRGVTYQGAKPEILPGRDGMQFTSYIESQIREMLQAVNLEELLKAGEGGAVDPYTMLYRSAKNKAHFSSYAEKYGQYVKDFITILLELAKFYLPDDELIPAIGRAEMVNVEEFRSSQPLRHEIVVEAMDDTVETMLGRQLTFNHILQYVGQNLDKENIGKLIKSMPFGNFEDGFSDLTIDDDIITNDMLALERGEPPTPPGRFDNNEKMIKKLSKRMREPDFKYLDPRIQEGYAMKMQAHEQAEVQRQEQIVAAKNEYIPADGPLIACEMYVEDPKEPDKAPKRARVPQRALSWLMDQLGRQGMSMEAMEKQNQGALAEMAQMMMSQQQQGPGLAESQQMQPGPM